MASPLLRGLAAGAAGTVALNASTYLDMALRGRPSSSLPSESAGALAQRVGLPLGQGETRGNRQEALGALLGLAAGLGVGAAFGLVRAAVPVPRPAAALALGAAAMAAGNGPMIALGLTDPRRWSASDWASDVVPHLAYGTAAAAVAGQLFD